MESTRLEIGTKLDHQLNPRDFSIVEESDEEVKADRDFNFQHYDEEETSDFSFACAEAASSPISAADLFHNGQIRPISQVFGNGGSQAASIRIPLKETASEEATTETACRKSNSTGFSRLWRFRDLLIRSQSDGKEKFVFLTENETASCLSSKKKKSEISKKGSAVAESKPTPSKPKGKTTSSSSSFSSYAMQYVKIGEKGREKRRSYLPYRQDLVGFFTNANAVSRNIHPY